MYAHLFFTHTQASINFTFMYKMSRVSASIHTYVPIVASKVGPLYHEVSSGTVEGFTRFSPVSPLHGT